MVIIFYDAKEEHLYICSKREKMQIVPIDDPDLMSYIPNDDILYVSNGHMITKYQFSNWLSGNMKLEDSSQFESDSISHNKGSSLRNLEDKLFIHPVHNGALFIPDITTSKFPEGVSLVGKYNFVCVDDLGGMGVLEESAHYKALLRKGKIEVVSYDYVKRNQDKVQKLSARDQALKSILIPNDRRGAAEEVAASGGMSNIDPITSSDPIPVFVEGDLYD